MSCEICDQCGGTNRQRFEGETFVIEHEDLRAEVPNLSGWRCGTCGEADFDDESTLRYVHASDALVMAARRRVGKDLRRIRRRLGLTQERAARLTGGGHNAFSRYERGEAPPMPAVVNLFRLLDRHPELLRELTVEPPAKATTQRAGETDLAA